MRSKTAFLVLCLLSVAVLPAHAEGAMTGNSTPTENQKDATSDMRRKQLESDMRARMQRAKVTKKMTNGDVESLVRDQLEYNMPKRSLNVKANNGTVILEGKVASKAEANQAIQITKSVPGVKRVTSKLVMENM
ncbi:MAG: BON domain-containing protein [Anaerolineae bacterium]|nr:BON domain-containing protein [Gloeobacterales cyanobacterium ES-bin-313]